MARKLPPENSDELKTLSPNELSAYIVCLTFQEQVAEETNIIHARLLGYLILHAPNQIARSEMVRAIHSCEGDFGRLSELGQLYINCFIRACKSSFGIGKALGSNPHSVKKYKGRTPASSDHPSRPSFEKRRKDIQSTILKAPTTYKDAKEQVSRLYFVPHIPNS